VDNERDDLHREIASMHTHKEAQEGRVELNIGGYRFETSVQALRRVPHTFFDAYFSGRYAQDVCDDGSIFVDRDGEHFGHVLEYMRDGVVLVAEPGAHPSVSLLRALKREFGFYCIELCAVEPTVEEQPEMVFAMGGWANGGDEDDEEEEITHSSMEKYDIASDVWSTAAALGTARNGFGACAIAGELYVSGGNDDNGRLASVEKYTPSSDSWSAVAALPERRSDHAAVTVGSAMYVLGGILDTGDTAASMRKYDSTLGAWSDVAPMPGPRCAFAVCGIGGDIYVFGGLGDGVFQATVFKYDTANDTWSILALMPQVSHAHSASVLDGQIYIVGANGGNGVLRFDPASTEWSTLASTVSDRTHGASFVLGNCLYAAGSSCDDGTSVERYDVATDTWASVANMLEGRYAFGAVAIIGSAGSAKDQDLFDELIEKVEAATLANVV
jgi:hypothetical protein